MDLASLDQKYTSAEIFPGSPTTMHSTSTLPIRMSKDGLEPLRLKLLLSMITNNVSRDSGVKCLGEMDTLIKILFLGY